MKESKIRTGGVRALLGTVLVTLVSFGCDSGPTSPTPASGSGTQETAEVVVSGTFSSANALSSGLAGISQTDVNDITVEVVGTGQSVAVSNGTFALSGLPAGSFTLVFRDGTGKRLGKLTFDNVQAGQTIELLLELHDEGVVLLKEVRDGEVVVDNSADETGNDDGDGDGNNDDAGNGDSGESPSLQGSLSGKWSGQCDDENVSGRFSISVSAGGSVSGSYSGDDSGSISGRVRNNGSFSAAAGSAGECQWSGTITRSGNSLSGSGTWTCPEDCDGDWSGSGS